MTRGIVRGITDMKKLLRKGKGGVETAG